jgi:hypothetical protein
VGLRGKSKETGARDDKDGEVAAPFFTTARNLTRTHRAEKSVEASGEDRSNIEAKHLGIALFEKDESIPVDRSFARLRFLEET